MKSVFSSLAWEMFRVPKSGHSADEYEDAFAGNPACGRFAVADGASESSFAAVWARILVETFVAQKGPWSRWLGAARRQWADQTLGRDLPWYAESKRDEGAFATLLGMSFRRNGTARSLTWQAAAVGDSCLFQVSRSKLRVAFPVQCSADFDNHPALLCSQERAPTKIKRRRLTGRFRQNDRLYLMTDALAQWFLSRVEKGDKPWDELDQLRDQESFGRWIDELRHAKEIRNDDVTLIRVCRRKD
jgi:hypothetical protein